MSSLDEKYFQSIRDPVLGGNMLVRNDTIRAEVHKIVERQNRRLANFETLKDFVLLDHDLSIEAGDLIPTMKVKRREIFKKYGVLMEAPYGKSKKINRTKV